MPNDQTVYIVDDDEGVRDSLLALLESNGLAVETFASGGEFLDAQDGRINGCLLLDVQMPEMDGLQVLEKLVADGLMPPVIMITGYGEVRIAVKAMKAGALDFVEKPFAEEVILDSVRRALELDAQNRRRTESLDAAQAGLARLTARERDVLEQLVIGQQNKVIAFELGISARTVEIHRARVMEKMGARNLSHLIRMALSLGLDPDQG